MDNSIKNKTKIKLPDFKSVHIRTNIDYNVSNIIPIHVPSDIPKLPSLFLSMFFYIISGGV